MVRVSVGRILASTHRGDEDTLIHADCLLCGLFSSLGCLIDKLEGCDQSTIESAGGMDMEQMQNVYATYCSSENCDLMAVQQCEIEGEYTCRYFSNTLQVENGNDRSHIYFNFKWVPFFSSGATCMFETLSGCPQEVMEQLGQEDFNMEDLEFMMHMVCASENNTNCDIVNLDDCEAMAQADAGNTEAICRYVLLIFFWPV